MVTSSDSQQISPPEIEQNLALKSLRDRLRPGQQRMADWQGGALAVSAVPGSGKSTGMAIASALLLARRFHSSKDAPGQLALVTFTRSAVANLKSKIRQSLKELSLPPQGFMVSTLHGLALNIAAQHPELSGLNLSRMTLVSPSQSSRLIRACVEQWLSANPQAYQQLLEGRQADHEETERLRRQSVLRSEVLPELAFTAIHEAKSSGLLPQNLQEISRNLELRGSLEGATYNVLEIAAGLYDRYQTLLQSRGYIDYDDMILAALRVLENESARQLWQSQIYAVFEDEAQDSSPLQTRLLEILATHPIEPRLNLIRVGDPNQAINSTFTPADPSFFNDFCQRCQTQGRLAEMDQAGRSTQMIIDAANFMLDWVNDRYSPAAGETAQQSGLTQPFRPQHIHPVSAHDPQSDANPAAEGIGLEICFPKDIYRSVALIAQQVADRLTHNPEGRAAVLVRENRQGRFLAEVLRNPAHYGIEVNLEEIGIKIYDVGDRDRHSHVPAEVLTLLQFLDRPHSPDYLKAALRVLSDRQLIPPQDLNRLVSLPRTIPLSNPARPHPSPEPVLRARRYCAGLLRARLELPQYQLISFLAMTLQYDPAELASADKLAERISQQTAADPSMTAILEALGELVRSERFEPIETDDSEARYTRPSQLTIMTMHKAKGLDWDYVFLPFLHEALIPGSLRVLPQAQFLGDFTLSEVARAQIRAYIHGETTLPDIETAWNRAGVLKTAEEFRLLYVAMTRARKLLWMSAARQAPFTWSKPENLSDRPPCPVLPALARQFPQAVLNG
ncbi:MAG: ATP-dependent helicase [Leptolyngbyaceae cyanobacterium CSU_1_4]|nr:ATP-dependent helicase [Leptolyngbyaceae cyanobacterium CSU_1_4]